jgi:hypothetical protein
MRLAKMTLAAPRQEVLMANDKWTPDRVADVLCDPTYCLNGTVADEKWIQAGIRLINERGAEEFLRRLLAALRRNH